MDEYVVLRADMMDGHSFTTCLVSADRYNGNPADYFGPGWDKTEEAGRIEIGGDVRYLQPIYRALK